jgi:hypothetical protein
MPPTLLRVQLRSRLLLGVGIGSSIASLGCAIDARSVEFSGAAAAPVSDAGASATSEGPVTNPSANMGMNEAYGSGAGGGSSATVGPSNGASGAGGAGVGNGGLGGMPAAGLPSAGSSGSPAAAGSASMPPASETPPTLLSLSVAVTGSGLVTSDPPGIDCPGACSASFARGTAVTLTEERVDGSGEYREAWQGACAGAEVCVVSMNEPASVSVSFGPPNIAFVTSTRVAPGTLGGVAGADALCQQRAAAGGLSGTYRAWLQTDAASAASRFASSRGWVRPDGRAVADSAESLGNSNIFYPITLDESGAPGTSIQIATGVFYPGTGPGTCNDWTDPTEASLYGYGSGRSADALFQIGGLNYCNVPGSFYCLGTGRQVKVAPDRTAGRVAFASVGRFTPGSGVGPADALCAAEAARAGLTGSFRAELATSTALPQSRFDLAGPPWVRVDGVQLAATARAYFEDDVSLSAPTLTAGGVFITTDVRIWLGMSFDGSVSDATTCQSWLGSGEAATGFSSSLGSTENPAAPRSANTCTNGAPVICLQE